MKKLITFCCAAVLACSSMFAQGTISELIIKPMGFTGAGTDGMVYPKWNNVDAKTEPAYKMTKVEGVDSLYVLKMTLDTRYRSGKWKTTDGVSAPEDGSANNGWYNVYSYRIVTPDNYDAVTKDGRGFEVPQDGTEVTFYAKVLKGYIYVTCDAQEFQFNATEAGGGQGLMSNNIGQAYTSKGITTTINGTDQANAFVSSRLTNDGATAYKVNLNNGDFGGKYAIKNSGNVLGRNILTLHYPTVSFSAEKSIDELQNIVENISTTEEGTPVSPGDLGEIDDTKGIFLSGGLSTVVTKTAYPLTAAVSEDNVSVSLCYQITGLTDADEIETLRIPLTLESGATNLNGDWTLASVDLLEGKNLNNGDYTISYWFESVYTGQYGQDTIPVDGGGGASALSFTLNKTITGIDNSTLEAKVSAANGVIKATFEGEANVKLYSALGQLVAQEKANGNFSQSVRPGIYILQIDSKSYKLIVK